MHIEHNPSLKEYNTFGIDAKAKAMATFHSVDELSEILSDTTLNQLPRIIVGFGSNLIFNKDYEGLILKNRITGIEGVD